MRQTDVGKKNMYIKTNILDRVIIQTIQGSYQDSRQSVLDTENIFKYVQTCSML